MEIAIISDTHLPRGARRLPEECVTRLRAAELIVHAGDLVAISVLRELEAFAPVVAIHGNVDDAEVCATLPETTTIELDGARLGVIHDAGPRSGRLQRLRRRFGDCDAVVFGHSHLPLHEHGADGFQIFNPGSPTERRRAPHKTMGVARAQAGSITFELVTLE